MFTVLEIAPQRNGWAAAIIVTCAVPGNRCACRLRGLKAQSNTLRCSGLQIGAPSIVSFFSMYAHNRFDLRLVVAERFQRQRHGVD